MSCLFAFLYCSWDSQDKNTGVVCHSLLQWTMFCQNSPQWPIHLGQPSREWIIVSLSETKLWSMISIWLVFYACAFHSACPLRDKDKRLVEASSWEGLTVGETWSSSDGWAMLSSVHFSRSFLSDSLSLHGLQQARPPCPSSTPKVYSNSCPLSQWCHPTISSLSSPSPTTFSLSQH